MMQETAVILRGVEPLLVGRLRSVVQRLQAGDEAAWSDFLETVKALSALLPILQPGANGGLLSTREMASQLGVTPKSLLRLKSKGRIRPALETAGHDGKGRRLIRWSGREEIR